MTKRKGRLLTLEGGEGAGKSELIQHVVKYLTERGLDVVATREPGGTDLATKIRNVALAKSDEPMPDEAELLLMFAARAVHLQNKVLPALREGKWVVCDRYVDSSYVYQGFARGLPESMIDALTGFVVKDVQPDLTLLLDLPPEVGLQRAKSRGPSDRIEDEQIEFFNKVRQGFLARMEKHPNRFRYVDASGSRDEVIEQAIEHVDRYRHAVEAMRNPVATHPRP